MTDKGFNLFDECAFRFVHLFPQEVECSSSSWEKSKMYRSGSIANSQKILTEINEVTIVAKIMIWVILTQVILILITSDKCFEK